ncbi:MAG TPA: YkgJ family cysteine cluster protein, partial [Desulfomonilaceae bacterium]|nr:YkgJ family cysteine cluster protein [Desulfomonilaceae bacterium]
TRPYCVRCGTCCTKGSPTLLSEDIILFNRDLLKPSDVITVRKGEWVRAHAQDRLEPTEKELIKIREVPGSTACIFFEPEGKSCSIYDARPLQCRQQECWDPQDCDEIRDQAVLNRAALLSETRPLWDIILRHEERCSCEELARVMAKLGATRGQAVEELLELLRFDQHVRSFIKENFRLAAEAMDFFLGRSLSQAVEPYGLRVVEEPDGSFLLTMLDDAGDQ